MSDWTTWPDYEFDHPAHEAAWIRGCPEKALAVFVLMLGAL